MMILYALFGFPLSTASGPVDAALQATEAPDTLRAAFTVELKSDRAIRIFEFDPRLPEYDRWRIAYASGEDSDLDQVAATWGAESAPDGWLFPDDLRTSLGQRIDADDLGEAWRVRFRHTPSRNDGEFDVWAAERLSATAWLDPIGDRFVRIDYALPKPVRGPDGGKIKRYDQSYYLETEPTYQMSFVSAFTIDLEASAAWKTIRRSYSARIVNAEFFFANERAHTEFVALRQGGTGVDGQTP